MASNIHTGRTLGELLKGTRYWSVRENEDWDGHPKSYDIVALLTGNNLKETDSCKFSHQLSLISLGEKQSLYSTLA